MLQEVRLVYVSEAKISSTDDIRDILQTANHRNRIQNISGVLWWYGGYFVQILEGDSARVESLYGGICRDDRHGHVEMLEKSIISKRYFAQWDMAYYDAGAMIQDYCRKFLGSLEIDPYTVSKEALVSMLQALAKDYPPKMDRILGKAS